MTRFYLKIIVGIVCCLVAMYVVSTSSLTATSWGMIIPLLVVGVVCVSSALAQLLTRKQ